MSVIQFSKEISSEENVVSGAVCVCELTDNDVSNRNLHKSSKMYLSKRNGDDIAADS